MQITDTIVNSDELHIRHEAIVLNFLPIILYILHCSKIVLIILTYVTYYSQFMPQNWLSKSWEELPASWNSVAVQTTL